MLNSSKGPTDAFDAFEPISMKNEVMGINFSYLQVYSLLMTLYLPEIKFRRVIVLNDLANKHL